VNTIDSNALIEQMQALAAQAGGGARGPEERAEEAGFAALLGQSISEVNALQQDAARLTEAFEQGDPAVSLAEVQVALQKSSISFQALTQVRNKLISAYQDIMNMPI
jgi:flagellar hook-basal body complex protein FliE